MSIATEKILDKMETLITQAKHAQTREKQQGNILAVKALCELLVEEDSNYSGEVLAPSRKESFDKADPIIAKRMDMEDANGGSLLDF
ncbi:MAG: DUF5327 family protein [Bacillus sp. (in: firmicutes)]